MILALCVSYGAPGRAAEVLKFNTDIARSSFERIKLYVSNNLESDINTQDIAKTDLNNDGLYEFILRPKGCGADTKCRYMVLAEDGPEIYTLGDFEGVNLLLGAEFKHGIRNLLVFNNAANDFDYELYTWHPKASAYRKSGS